MAAIDDITETVLMDYLDAVKLDIFFEQDQLDIVASGFSSKNTKVLKGTHSNQAFLKGPEYLFTNFDGVGRRKGKAPDDTGDIIRQWIREKGIIPRNKAGRFITYDAAAFLIGRKIAKQGTDIKTGKRRGIPIDAILKRNLPPTGRKLALAYAQEMGRQVANAAKT